MFFIARRVKKKVFSALLLRNCLNLMDLDVCEWVEQFVVEWVSPGFGLGIGIVLLFFFSQTGGESILKPFKFLGKCFTPTTATTTTSTPIVYISINLYLNFTFFICSQMRQRL